MFIVELGVHFCKYLSTLSLKNMVSCIFCLLILFWTKIGGKHHRFKRGYKNVIDEGIRLVSLLLQSALKSFAQCIGL